MGRPGAAERLRRVVALVPWIVDHPDTTLRELAQRFGVDEREIEGDLNLLMMCGLPPYSPDQLIDVFVDDDGHVDIVVGDYFRRPLQLTPEEGVAVLAAGYALLEVPGSDPDGALASALAKLDAAIGARGAFEVDVTPPGQLTQLRRAAAEHERVEIDYWSYARGELTTRRIDPYRVFHAFGHWYCAAWCHRAGAERIFRVDRVRASRATGEHFEPPPDGDDVGAAFRPHAEDPRVTLELAPAAAWVLEAHPHEEHEVLDDGSIRVRLAVAAPGFLDRLLLRLGPNGRVVDPPQWRDRGATAARQVLARYA